MSDTPEFGAPGCTCHKAISCISVGEPATGGMADVIDFRCPHHHRQWAMPEVGGNLFDIAEHSKRAITVIGLAEGGISGSESAIAQIIDDSLARIIELAEEVRAELRT